MYMGDSLFPVMNSWFYFVYKYSLVEPVMAGAMCEPWLLHSDFFRVNTVSKCLF